MSLFEKIIRVEISGVFVGSDEGKDFVHVIKVTNKGRYALRKNGQWFKIDKGGWIPMDCAFQRDDKSLDVWRR